MAIRQRYYNIALTTIFLLAAWIFWSVLYPYALIFQEQLQLFLFDQAYLVERLSMPAGVARYIAEFLVQFYNHTVLGGLIVALAYVAIQQLVWAIARPVCKSKVVGYILSFVPSLMLWAYMGSEKVKFTFVIALILALLAIILCPSKEKRVCKLIYTLIAVPLLAWIAGPTVLVFAFYIAVRDNLRKPIDWTSLALILYAPACILVSSRFAQAPPFRLFYGIHYNLDVVTFPTMQYAIMAAAVILPAIIAFIPALESKKERIFSASLAAVVILASSILIPKSFDSKTYEVIKYDALVRGQKWDELIAAAEKKHPDTPLSVAMLNLSLAVKGVLSDRAFDFYQNGWQGAFPQFNKDYETSFVTAETYFYLGLVNSAQRLDFEAMEALPDNAKSARAVMRLAETNLINGQYAVARKYLRLLQKTMFYSRWATRTLALLGDEKAINEHSLYGHLRRLHLKNDFTFSEQEIDKIMGQLVLTNHKNVLAIQYLLLLPQLEGNQQKYNAYREFVNSTMLEPDTLSQDNQQ